jgi:4-hydroxy-2-oxoheptanedioate aldolase
MIPSPFVVEMFCHQPFDWIGLDLQHGLWSHDQLVGALQVVDGFGLPSIVRVTGANAGEIGRVLDAGASGIIVPMVDSAAEAEEAVAACRFPPLGRRSFGPVRAALGRPEWTTDGANDEVICVVMVETRGGLAHLDEILGVQGVDAILVGAFDLSLTHGAFGDPRARWDLVHQVFGGCRQNGVPYGIAVASPEDARAGKEAGGTLIALAPDAWLFTDAIEGYLRACGIEK